MAEPTRTWCVRRAAEVDEGHRVLVIGAAAGVAQLGLETSDALVALVVFVLVASLSVLAPVAYFFAGGDKARQGLDELKAWLGANNAAVMAVLLLVFGVLLVSNASAR